MMKRSMCNAVLDMPEVNRFSKGIFSWVGFKKKWLEYENIERKAGETKWNFWKLFKYSLEGIVAFSTKPLSLSNSLALTNASYVFNSNGAFNPLNASIKIVSYLFLL